ncbi:hypothetical protein ABZY81_43135 [Streptomyces sp. NPDC006514]|uniref:hypothetical protein n=1 Tax=Streptomyces sp. NPDC006514 TaxID=3154308 RepID=UPI0033A8555B
MAGRPQGKLRGRTDEANALAEWLRDVTRGKTTRVLVEELTAAGFPYAKTSWSEVLSGSRPPSRELIEAVVSRYVTTDGAARLRDGLELLEAARQADQALGDGALPSAAPRGVRLGPVAQAYKDLAAAQQKNAEAWQKLHESEIQRRALEKTVSLLGARCTKLEVQLEQAKEGRAELEQELEQLRDFRHRAGGQLEHARRLEEKAFTVQTAAEQQVIRDEAVVHDLGGDVAPGAGLAVFAEEQILPRLEEIEQFLEVVEERLEAQDAELEELGEGVGLEPPAGGDTAAAGPPVVPGQPADKLGQAADPGVPGQRQDSQDNAVNSENDRSGQRDKQLLDLLETVQTPADMARSFKHLEERDGSSPRLSVARLAAKAFGDTPDTAQRWAAAQVLRLGTGKPMAWEHLEALVAALDATPEEVNAFERAHHRVGQAHALLVSKAPTPVFAIRPKDLPPAAAGPGTPPQSTEARFDGPALALVGIGLVSLALIVIGLFQHTPGPFADAWLTTAGWWFTGSGVFLGLTPFISLFVHDARTNPVAPSETYDQPYDQMCGYPPMA